MACEAPPPPSQPSAEPSRPLSHLQEVVGHPAADLACAVRANLAVALTRAGRHAEAVAEFRALQALPGGVLVQQDAAAWLAAGCSLKQVVVGGGAPLLRALEMLKDSVCASASAHLCVLVPECVVGCVVCVYACLSVHVGGHPS